MENRESHLPCRITDENQVKEYLTDLSVKLDANRKYKDNECKYNILHLSSGIITHINYLLE